MSTDVKVVLRADVSGLGKRGDVADVAPGFARNYLVPYGLAFVATAGAEEQAASMRKNRMLKDAADRTSAQEIASHLVSKVIAVSARAADGGKLFGSITVAEIADAVAAQTSAVIDRKSIHLLEPIKAIGTHQVPVRLHAEVEFPLTVEVSGS